LFLKRKEKNNSPNLPFYFFPVLSITFLISETNTAKPNHTITVITLPENPRNPTILGTSNPIPETKIGLAIRRIRGREIVGTFQNPRFSRSKVPTEANVAHRQCPFDPREVQDGESLVL